MQQEGPTSKPREEASEETNTPDTLVLDAKPPEPSQYKSLLLKLLRLVCYGVCLLWQPQ